jgi:hypothetical protein
MCPHFPTANSPFVHRPVQEKQKFTAINRFTICSVLYAPLPTPSILSVISL